jgi:hypothetical protein
MDPRDLGVQCAWPSMKPGYLASASITSRSLSNTIDGAQRP